MPESDPHDERVWEVGWEGHSRAQRRRLARLPFADKLRWLEEAQQVLLHLAMDRKRRGDGDRRDGGDSRE